MDLARKHVGLSNETNNPGCQIDSPFFDIRRQRRAFIFIRLQNFRLRFAQVLAEYECGQADGMRKERKVIHALLSS